MPKSLSSRIYGLAALFGLFVLLLASLLSSATERARNGFMWVQHTEEVLRTTEQLRASINQAESGQRSFILTRSPAYLRTFDSDVVAAGGLANNLARLTQDNPPQHARAARLQMLTSQRIEILKLPLALARSGRFDQAAATVSAGKGKALMDALLRQTDELSASERRLLEVRVRTAQKFSVWTRRLLAIGLPALTLLFAGFVSMLVVSVRRPLAELLDAMKAFGDGNQSARARASMGTREFDRLAASYNAMADSLSAALQRQQQSDAQLHAANVELREQAEIVADRGRSTQLLAAMAHRMQACRTDAELTAVLETFLPRVLPNCAGALYAHNNSRNLLVRLVGWGAPLGAPATFGPQECWGLRRGQSHIVASPGEDIPCMHSAGAEGAYHCEPVLAGGEVVGLLYIEGVLSPEEQFRLTILGENVALSLVNHRLQRTLKEQSIRDPLTGLFNRRYMEEALTLEAARSQRSGAHLGIIMCDVDHFKRFNDEFGHEAGDMLLQEVGTLLRSHFRDGDVACRYGGEEFAIIAPGADAKQLARRAERLRRAVAKLSLQHQGRSLGSITISAGIASWPVGNDEETAGIVRAADAALYAAKNGGRNRVALADPPAALEAAE